MGEHLMQAKTNGAHYPVFSPVRLGRSLTAVVGQANGPLRRY